MTAPTDAATVPVYAVPIIGTDGVSHVVRDVDAAAALLLAAPVPARCGAHITPAPLGRIGHFDCAACAERADAHAGDDQ